MIIADKIVSVRKWTYLPLALLLLALSTIFLFGGERHRFYRPDSNALTANHMTMAMNLSPERNFVGYFYRALDSEGKTVYFPYNRFPPGGYALIKLATLPFGDNLSVNLYVGRLLMLSFFTAAALFAYLALSRIVANRWVALTATLLAFASYYGLLYNDMVTPEGMPDLFGVMLTFHGIVIFAQEERFRQLLIKACIALALGWHVYALLLTFIALGLGSDLIRLFSNPRASISSYLLLLRSRYMKLGVVSLLVGLAVLTFNFTNEYFALNGETPLAELPSVQSALRRTGTGFGYVPGKSVPEWQSFLEEQLYRVGVASAPYALAEYSNASSVFGRAPWILLGAVMGIGAFGALLIDRRFIRRRMLLATLALFGFCWALLARQQVAFHYFEGVYYIGIPLVLFALALLFIRKRFGSRLIVGLAAAALAIFGLSAYQMSFVGNDSEAAERQESMFKEFQAIRDKIPQGKIVHIFIPSNWDADVAFAGSTRASIFYLSGRVIAHGERPRLCRLADFAITMERDEGAALITPHNRLRFLYERSSDSAQLAHFERVCQWKID